MAKPIPEGYRTVTPFLHIHGCAEAIELYKKAFGAEERAVMKLPDGKVMHAEIRFGDSIVMMSDPMGGSPTMSSVHLYVSDCDATFKRATDAGMKVRMELADQFWGDRYGVVEDRFGNRWGIATHKEDVPREEMKKRIDKAIADATKK